MMYHTFGYTFGEDLLYKILSIIIIGGITLIGFIIIKKSEMAKEWKYPNLINLTLMIIVSLVSFAVASLIIGNIALYFMIFNEYQAPRFFHIIMFMVFYMVFGLTTIKERKKLKKEPKNIVPEEVETFIPKSFMLLFALLFFLFSQYILLRWLGHPPIEIGLPPQPNRWADLVVCILSLIMGLMIASLIFFQSGVKKITDKIEKKLSEKLNKFLDWIKEKSKKIKDKRKNGIKHS